MIKISNLQKYYNKGKNNEIHVINDASIELPSTGLITFLGASGSGKTTLLNAIGGLDSAKGSINYDEVGFNNYPMNKIDAYRMKNIGYVFQNYNLLPNISVHDNLALSLNLIGISDEDEVSKRVDYCLSAVKMGKYRKRLASALSGGQQQRVSIARALVKNSKIIIADEPTGNLDSANSVEVMNILKKISETKLVLLVTHDKKIAHFYSDRIIEIQDGKIIKDEDNEMSSNTLDTRNSRVIYLKDLDKTTGEFQNIKMSIYGDNNDLKDLDLNVIFKDGNIYIEASNKNVKLIGANTEVALLDEHYEELSKQDVNNYAFDLSNFKDEPTKKRFSLRGIGRKFKTALSNFFNVRRRTKFLYFGFVVIGGMLAGCAISLGMYNHVDENSLMYEKNHLAVSTKYKYYHGQELDDYSAKIRKIVTTSEDIDSIIINDRNEHYVTFDFKINGSYQNFAGENSLRTYFLPEENLVNKEIYKTYGRLPQDKNEVLVDKTICDRIINQTKNIMIINYDQFIGLSLRMDNYTFKVSGIVDNDSVAIYHYGDNFYMGDKLEAESQNDFVDYEIVDGTNLDDSQNNQVLVNINYAHETKIGQSIVVIHPFKEPKRFVTKGFFKSDTVDAKYIVNDSDFVKYNEDSKSKGGNFFDISKHKMTLTEGTMPSTDNEVVVNYYSNNEVGSTINLYDMQGFTKKYKVVGKYYSGVEYVGSYGITHKMYLLNQLNDYNSPSVYGFYSSNPDKLIEEFAAEGLELKNAKDTVYNLQLEQNRQQYTFLFIIIAVLFVMVIIYVYLMMRAKMINKIYDIGVYRALGASKRKIYGLFFVELLVLTTFTTLIGYIIVCLMFGGIANIMKSIGDIFHFNPLYLISGIGLLYLFNIIFGLLPISLLLRKTPSEIISKYDI